MMHKKRLRDYIQHPIWHSNRSTSQPMPSFETGTCVFHFEGQCQCLIVVCNALQKVFHEIEDFSKHNTFSISVVDVN